jgi:hypothetical protein
VSACLAIVSKASADGMVLIIRWASPGRSLPLAGLHGARFFGRSSRSSQHCGTFQSRAASGTRNEVQNRQCALTQSTWQPLYMAYTHMRGMGLPEQVVLAVKLQPPAGTCEGRNGVVSQRLQSATPTLFVGERQLLWMGHWVKRAKSAPVYIAQASRLKQFKTAPRARDPTAKSIPRLLDDLQLSLSMLDFEVPLLAPPIRTDSIYYTVP